MKIFFFFFLSISNLWAQKITTCAHKLPGNMATSKDSGYLIEQLKYALKGYDYEISFYPRKRMIEYFKSGKCELLITAPEGYFKDTFEVQTGLVDYLTFFRLRKKVQGHYNNVALVDGWPIIDKVKSIKNQVSVKDINQAIKMLTSERIDQFFGYFYLVNSYIKDNGFEELITHSGDRYYKAKVVYVIQKSSSTKFKKFESRMKGFFKSPLYEKLVLKYHVPKELISE